MANAREEMIKAVAEALKTKDEAAGLAALLGLALVIILDIERIADALGVIAARMPTQGIGR